MHTLNNFPYGNFSIVGCDLESDSTINIKEVSCYNPYYTPYRWTTRQWGYWNTQKWLAGDFNGDGKDDLATIFNDAGLATINVHLSKGSSFTPQLWADQQWGYWDTQKWLAGDFNGDGKDDLATIINDAGLATINVHLSTGNSFSNNTWVAHEYYGYWDSLDWDNQKWLAGDFDGDGKDDLASVFNESGLASINVTIY